MQEKTEKKLHILLVYRRMIPSVRLCGHEQMVQLDRAGIIEYRAVQEYRVKKADIEWADTVWLCRLDGLYAASLARILDHAGRFVAYIMDDDLLNILPQVSSFPYYDHPTVQGNIRTMLRVSDGVISPSPRLLEKYAQGKAAIQVEEPAIHMIKPHQHQTGQPVKLGFAGSVDRTYDIETILKEVLFSLKEQYADRICIEFYGALPSFAEELGARCIPYCNSYEEYRATMNELQWDIGLAPMPDTPFHACKHYNKFVEYGAAGVVGVFSNVEPYTRLKKLSDKLCFCDNEAAQWLEMLKTLIENDALRESVREETARLIGEKMSVEASAQNLLGQMRSAYGQGKEKTPVDNGAFYGLKLFRLPQDLLFRAWRKLVRTLQKQR